MIPLSHKRKASLQRWLDKPRFTFDVLWKVQKRKCWLCGRFMNSKPVYSVSKKRRRWCRTIDHVYIPASVIKKRKKKDVQCNKLFACGFCNSSRGHSPLDRRQYYRARMLHIACVAYILSE